MTHGSPLACVLLAAGQGTRMRSRTPKVLHEVLGRTLLDWAVAACLKSGPDRMVVVVSPDADAVRERLPDGVEAATQERPLGTGDAVRATRTALEGFEGDVLVLYGDHPLTDPQSLRDLRTTHAGAGAAATVLTFERTATIGVDFGRIVRGAGGGIERIVEVRDASAAERAITEVNSGIYVFRSQDLWPALAGLDTSNDQGELYLTDAVEALAKAGRPVAGHRHPDPSGALGINTRADMAAAAAILRDRTNRAHMLAGVTIVDPATTWIDAGVEIEPDAVVHPFTVLRGATRVEEGAEVGPHVVAVDARIGPGAVVGPFCYLRPGADVGAGAKAGTFVEMKNSSLGEGAKVSHLSYIGDAEIGAGTNIGAGNITANYDGTRKQRTTIGRDVRTSSDTVFVAPVTIGDGAWTAAGSVITEDIPPDALGIARPRQRNIEGYGTRKRSRG
jgi:bifunctional UDP-N-acetylglucosamine pyrophosphorylase / glucosamine-1-phosphate N-acetyltransferase